MHKGQAVGLQLSAVLTEQWLQSEAVAVGHSMTNGCGGVGSSTGGQRQALHLQI